MSSQALVLRRLVSATAVDSLIQSFNPLLVGNVVALCDEHGALFAGAWPQLAAPSDPEADHLDAQWLAALRAAGMNAGPLMVAGVACYPLWVGEICLAWLLAESPGPACEVLRDSLLMLIGEGQEKRQLVREALDRYREVNLLYRVAETIGASLNPSEILQVVLNEAGRVIQAVGGLIVLRAEDGGPPQPAAGFGSLASDEVVVEHLSAWLDHGLPAQLEADGLLLAPLSIENHVLGLIALARRVGEPAFNAGDQKLLLALSGQAGLALEKAHLHQHELHRQRLEQELAIGEHIQRSLLPRAMPTLPGWEFAAHYRSAGQVGGDFYDITELPALPGEAAGSRLGLAIADVTGKGIPAALMMAYSHANLHAAATLHAGPGEILAYTNRQTLQNPSGLLLTAFYAILDPRTGRLRYANAGHELPYWYRAAPGSSLELASERSALLGVSSSRTFSEREVWLAPGDVLVLYTDGLTEARRADGEFFGEVRLQAVLDACGAGSSDQVMQAILHAVQSFTAGAPQFDDLTVFVMKRI